MPDTLLLSVNPENRFFLTSSQSNVKQFLLSWRLLWCLSSIFCSLVKTNQTLGSKSDQTLRSVSLVFLKCCVWSWHVFVAKAVLILNWLNDYFTFLIFVYAFQYAVCLSYKTFFIKHCKWLILQLMFLQLMIFTSVKALLVCLFVC